jgi:hypothetical protein
MAAEVPVPEAVPFVALGAGRVVPVRPRKSRDMIGGYRSADDLRVAVAQAAQQLQARLERELKERHLPIPFVRDGRVYARTVDGIARVA